VLCAYLYLGYIADDDDDDDDDYKLFDDARQKNQR
jgi:hypothetical protein